MNKVLCKIGVCGVLLLLAATLAHAKDWRGIVPLKSTRSDVERLLGRPRQSSDSHVYYRLSSEIVVFHFQNHACDSHLGKFGLGWNVPFGTVVGIGVIPIGSHRREEYLKTSDAKLEDNGGGFIFYSDDQAGLSVETYKDRATLLNYYPEAKQENLSCPRIQKCCLDLFPTFDEYRELSFADEKARLDNFLISLNQAFGRGTYEVLGPSKRAREKRMKLAARAKAYLVKQRGLEPERLLIIDGGFREDSMTRLSLYSVVGLRSRIILFPESDPVAPRRPSGPPLTRSR